MTLNLVDVGKNEEKKSYRKISLASGSMSELPSPFLLEVKSTTHVCLCHILCLR